LGEIHNKCCVEPFYLYANIYIVILQIQFIVCYEGKFLASQLEMGDIAHKQGSEHEHQNCNKSAHYSTMERCYSRW